MLSASLLAEAATGQEGQPNILVSMLPIFAVLAIGYFLLWRPARKQEADRKAMVGALKENDKIVNQGGIIGQVASIKEKEDEVVLKGGLRITKSSIVRVIRDDSAKH